MSWRAWTSQFEFSGTCTAEQTPATADVATATSGRIADETPRQRRARALARRAETQKARREWIVRVGETSAELPMWTSRDGWLTELAAWLATDEGLAECARLHIRPDRVLRACAELAGHADHATGRNCAVTNATVAAGAGCSERTVTNARVVLSASGFGIEIQRGTGSKATPGYGRRPSVWHLISRSTPVSKAVVVPPVCELPPSRRDRRSSNERFRSPNARERARGTESAPPGKSPTRRRRSAPRPLAVQRLADELVGNAYGRAPLCHGLDRGHIGAICEAIMAAGIDPAIWSAAQLKAALNDDMKKRCWDWPNHIENPGAFLASRLRLLPERPAGAPQGGVPAASLESSRAAVERQPVGETRASEAARHARWCADITAVTSPAQRAMLLQAHKAMFGSVTDPVRAFATAGRRATQLYPHLQLTAALTQWATDVLGDQPNTGIGEQLPVVTTLSDDLALNLAAGNCDCVKCGAPNAPLRPQLPFEAMSMVCDTCWPAVADELGVFDQEMVA